MKFENHIHVTNEGLVQGWIKYNERNYWYECDMGDQYLAEMDGDPGQFEERDAACLCEALNKTHIDFRNDGDLNSCEGIWSDDLSLHSLIAGMCLTVLLKRND